MEEYLVFEEKIITAERLSYSQGLTRDFLEDLYVKTGFVNLLKKIKDGYIYPEHFSKKLLNVVKLADRIYSSLFYIPPMATVYINTSCCDFDEFIDTHSKKNNFRNTEVIYTDVSIKNHLKIEIRLVVFDENTNIIEQCVREHKVSMFVFSGMLRRFSFMDNSFILKLNCSRGVEYASMIDDIDTKKNVESDLNDIIFFD